MASITDICNAALSHCGTRSKIASIDEGSAEANACLTHFTMARDTALRAFDWNFARLTQPLAQQAAGTSRWAYQYALPTDLVRLRRLNDVPLLALPETFCELAAAKDGSGSAVPVILTNAPAPLSAIYTAQVSDPARWDAGFADAMALSLAWRICFELTGKEDRVKALTQMWAQFELRAAAGMANESSGLNRTYLPEAAAARGFNDGLSETGQVWPTAPWGW